MNPKKRTTPFQKGHEVTYGLRVTDVDPKTNLACSVVCRFCEIFAREEQLGRKRKATRNAQYYTTPFRPESYRKHNETQHASNWREYQALADDKKGSFFDGVVTIKSTLLSHFRLETAPRLFEIDVAIVDTIIGSMYFDVDDESDSDKEADEVEVALCRDGRRRPDLTPSEIQKRALNIFSTKELTGMACYSGCNRRKVSSFLRVMCASNLQMLSDLLTDCWAFSLALDGAIHQSTSYFDIRVLDVIRTVWRDSLIGVATDGARNMTGRHVGLLTFLDNATGPNFIRVWCGAHQLDLIMADVYQNLLQDDFYSVLVSPYWLPATPAESDC
ncbi:hypothetical protein BASA62_007457 [Batrachochytrium salamandrivorans]|nr:hypothetical protein BASA62_007457 [Batrachochytrium salamandrivorans]